ncbi:hypothetical protein RhiirC2_717298 [Rhizophagus irregularis]|uniref:CCHC-type domain-containing protein n=1 Tax=Rhizophagus irregularis TaxID=588596 RepID=A0A2N1MMX5_9GLOM|nr:hypothetical protein RhiirC2_717298 [Rhizophagus irregularis]
MRNSLCHKKFEIEWKALTDEFPACKQYLTSVLYPCKRSWASYAINQNFTAGIQSTQRVEVMNKIIKDKLNRSSCLTDIVKEVQKTFDQQSKKAILSECKNEIPTKGIPSIMDEYFLELDKILREYLTPQILQKQRDQMAQSLCYNTILIEDWLPLLDIGDDFYQQKMAREDDYDQPQSLFSSLIENISHNSIQQVWKGPKQKYGFGMGYAKKALDLAIQTDKVDEFVNQVKYFIENTKVELSEHQENIVSMHIGDPLRVQHKGRQPNRYRSCGEPQKKKARHMRNITNITNNENEERVVATQAGKTRERHCKKCHQTGHYAPRCPNVFEIYGSFY